MGQSQAETAVRYLTEKKGVQIQDIADRLHLTRNQLNSWRRSNQEKRMKELLQKIIGAYPEYFPGGIIPEEVTRAEQNNGNVESDIQIKYIALLEQNLQEVKAERDRLRQELSDTIALLEQNLQEVKAERDRLRQELSDTIERLKKESS